MRHAIEHEEAEGQGAGRTPVTGRSSFTLIELLTVVAIIIVLSGIALKVTSLVQRKTGSSSTMRILEQVKNALGAYYTVYGTYPPGIYNEGTNVTSEIEYTPAGSLPATPEEGLGYRRGLVSRLWYGPQYNPDPEAKRWQHYLEGLRHDSALARSGNASGFAGIGWTNTVSTISDGWGRDLRYECLSPYQSFRLWSDGPNGRNDNGATDDIGIKWME